MEDTDQEYRNTLETLERESQQAYDKAVLTLSGGALGISFAFVSNFLDKSKIICSGWLITAWISWGVSVTAVLFSFFFSILALRKAIKQVDNRTIREERPGGSFDTITAVLNAAGGLLFLVGVISIITFVIANMR